MFDGINLPYSPASFDIIFCHQVLEHVRYPDKLIAEAFRALKPKAWFIGSVSYLEPFHSHSIFNFTPYGVVQVFTDAGFSLKELRPGHALYFINQQLLNHSKLLSFIWGHDYLYGMLELTSQLTGIGYRERNFLKIQFAGHLVFLAQRP